VRGRPAAERELAIRGEVMRPFLDNNPVNFAASRSNTKLESTDIASHGAAVTVRVLCAAHRAHRHPALRASARGTAPYVNPEIVIQNK